LGGPWLWSFESETISLIKLAVTTNRLHHWLYMAGLMLAGESIYMLPYMRKTFQTSMEQVFEVNSTEIGLLNSMFGILAIACYFPSGWLADRFSARKLLTISLVTTSAGGFFMMTLPDYSWLIGIHAWWGVTSILTFWGALIKATRSWGRPDNQGTSFGLLDAGRGATAAILATLATLAFAYASSTKAGLQGVLLVYSVAPLLAGAIIWLVVPDTLDAKKAEKPKSWQNTPASSRMKQVIQKPAVWLLSLIIFCSYILFIGTYDFPAYAEKAYDQSKTFGATLGTIRDWMRPIAALGAGLLADKFRASRTISGAFVLLMAAFGSLYFLHPSVGSIWILWVQVIAAALAVFALRGVYFALLQEIGIPNTLTGTTVGLVSFIGFMPDIFAHLLSGWFVETFNGLPGYHYYFGFLALVAFLGLGSTFVLGGNSDYAK
jgi:nitrate/nitrite transporter NarK